jgi:hypothetical protein
MAAGLLLFFAPQKGKVHKNKYIFLTKRTIAYAEILLYNVCIQAECVYSTLYRRASAN